VGHITDALLDLHGPVIYAVVAALVFAEAALFFGFVFPGETAIVVGGVLASQHRVSLPILLIVIAVSAVVGDSIGYEIGRRFGDHLLDTKALRKHRGKLGKAQDLLRRRGALAVFIGRFTALLRAIMPALAGSARMPYGRFLVFNALGGITWGVGFTVGGYLVGTAFEQVAQWAGRVLAIAVGAIAVIAIFVWWLRRKRRESAEEAGETGEPVPVPDLREGSDEGEG
jgi:membrane-associated protein